MTRAYKQLPPAADLWDLFDYKPLTGELVWRVDRGLMQLKGKVAGSVNAAGYHCISVGGLYQAHRLVWAWVTGSDPGAFDIDHRDRNRLNNRWSNLRKATPAQNSRNTAGRGYRLTRNGRRYEARIVSNCTHTYLGTFDTPEEAGAAYAKAAQELHGEFACTVGVGLPLAASTVNL